MESYRIENLSFAYPERKNKALDNISVTIKKGEFVTLCGKSGCGKTTFLRLLKPSAAPHGKKDGEIYFHGKLLCDIDEKGQVSEIGYVMQSPENQIVTDKVWHELAFGLESLGYSNSRIRARVAETASFFGIQTWFHKKVTELSGGQKQLLNLAAVMTMRPSVLLLDEPTSQLDPIAAHEFLNMLVKINRELGTTIILSEHRLEEVFPISDRVVVMENGKILSCETPQNTAKILKNSENTMYFALPAPMRVYSALENGTECPVTVSGGRVWLEEYSKNHIADKEKILKPNVAEKSNDMAVELKDVWFRYEKNAPDVIKGLNVKIEKGTFFAVVGGNGAGKTTALSVMCGLKTAYRGKVLINGERISEIKNPYNGLIGVLPQNPQTLFVKKTVKLDLEEILKNKKMTQRDIDEKVGETAELCNLTGLLESHPYDLSGGEQQRAALAKVLLQNPKILFLDEPTKGMDAEFKQTFAKIIKKLTSSGVTVVAVSHDIEFCAEYADKCAMFFDGCITADGTPREFFAGNNFYTTAANRMAGTVIPQAVLAEDIISAYGGEIPQKCEPEYVPYAPEEKNTAAEKNAINPIKIIFGIAFALLFIMTEIFKNPITSAINTVPFQMIAICECAAALAFLLPAKKIGAAAQNNVKRKFTVQRFLTPLFIIIAVPITMYIGVHFLADKKYYFISLMIILETLIPFCASFEKRKPPAKEIVTVSVLCAIAVAGRTAFYMIPEFKASAAVIIISGACFGGETGFLIGAVTGFVSNFFFGQGPWTPWQMFAFGLLGLLAGAIFGNGFLKKSKHILCVYGFVSVLAIYGIVMNTATLIMTQQSLNFEMIAAACAAGLPFDLVHASSTAFFLWFAAEPMTEKLERVKLKYGLGERF